MIAAAAAQKAGNQLMFLKAACDGDQSKVNVVGTDSSSMVSWYDSFGTKFSVFFSWHGDGGNEDYFSPTTRTCKSRMCE
jgi:hypothetical protein